MNQPSLTRHLLAWTLGALLAVWGTFIFLGYRTGQHEADELTDGHLASASSLLLSFRGGEFIPEQPGRTPMLAPAFKAHDYQQSMSVVVWDRSGKVLTRSGTAPVPEFEHGQGFATLNLGQPPEPWRVFSRWDEAEGRKVMVLLSLRERDELAADIAEQIAEPGLWLLPVVALALGLAIRRGLRPLYELSRDVHSLDVRQAGPLVDRWRHREFRATVMAINTLMERYQAALTRERALANEFAHEMRTPLAAVSLHARALKAAAEGPDRDQLLARLDRDVLRAGQVMSDLLALARASRAEWDESAQELDLVEVARRVVADFAPSAHESGHELALAGPERFPMTGHPLLLELAVRNLVENAVSHTPRGTHVEVQLDAQQRWLQVGDDAQETGPAPPKDRQAGPIRALGLGLGHRVVEKIAAIHGARFELVRQAGFSSCYRISFDPKRQT
ncbi:histidine kinase dimerization/phospho-acceptor domain-containing protein [Caenimonas soli]|uniref:histidine kinase dimerization/phospho-acceptor domain-containing protein n=1 Tax=Caenimonas soli TaxID=2735555 RepID=UPI001A9B2A57|nr:histidine kinase dimerization/phospho-acceptor domain-containing protein [Caenimonas soli]NPC58000.1 two-component sensor histidine kinase [Caenimonas soli]